MKLIKNKKNYKQIGNKQNKKRQQPCFITKICTSKLNKINKQKTEVK